MTLEPALVKEQTVEASPASAGLVRAASIIAAGNVASRLLGLVRETVIADLFGATGYVSIFRVASTIIQTLYDFLVGGAVSAALVPAFSEFAARENRDELWHVASVVINVLAITLAIAVLILEIFAPQVVWLLGGGYDPALQDTAVGMIRLILPAVFFLGMSGIVTGLLYSLKRFTYPAFTTAAYNAAIIIVALALSRFLGLTSLILGIIAGSAFQVILQLPGLRDMHFRLVVDFKHPTLRRILRLYVPVIGGLTVGTIGVVIDRNLASHTGAQSLAWMQDATVLTQFPLGLVATAISFAILPVLSRAASDGKAQANADFQQTLAFGLKLVLLLMLPAATGLFILASPIVSLLFEHGAFTATDSFWTATALRFYLIGLPFAAIDQPLVYAFYARKNTLAPNLVQFVAVGIYLVVALPLIQSFGMVALVIANSAQLTGHALIMLWLTRTRLGGLGRQGVIAMSVKVMIASAVMGFAAAFLLGVLANAGAGRVVQVAVPTAGALVTFIALLWALRVNEAAQLWHMIWSRSPARFRRLFGRGKV